MGNIQKSSGGKYSSSKKRLSVSNAQSSKSAVDNRLSSSDGLRHSSPFDGETVPVKFAYPTVIKWNDSNAGKVYLSGSHDNWTSSIPLTRSSDNFYTIIELPEGSYQFKFNVDGAWKINSDIKTIRTKDGVVNNVVKIKPSDFEVFEALAIDSKNRRDSECHTPDGEYTNIIPNLKHSLFATPPTLPPYLTNPLLNQAISPCAEPSLLPEPSSVMLNHLYALSIRQDSIVLSTTMRYKRKYTTTILYLPLKP